MSEDRAFVRMSTLVERALRAEKSFRERLVVERDYTGDTTLGDGDNRIVVKLIPDPKSVEQQTHADVVYEGIVQVAILRRVLPENLTAQVDAMLNLVVELCGWAMAVDQITYDGWTVTITEVTSDPDVGLFSQSDLRELGQFTAVLYLTCRVNEEIA